MFRRPKMQGQPQAGLQDRDKLGRYRPGFNPRVSKRLRVEAKLLELTAEYFPNGGYSVMDANRLKLAAQYYFTAETALPPDVRFTPESGHSSQTLRAAPFH